MKPTSILDPKFKYVTSKDTNIAKTFARIRREQEQAKAAQKAVVTPIKKERKKA